MEASSLSNSMSLINKVVMEAALGISGGRRERWNMQNDDQEHPVKERRLLRGRREFAGDCSLSRMHGFKNDRTYIYSLIIAKRENE